MAYDSDEEQIEAIKRWWRENGTSLIVSVAIVVLGLVGWRQWQSSQQESAEQAAELYQQMVALASGNPGMDIPEEDRARAAELNLRLREDFDGTIYPRLSGLFMAKLLVDAGDLAGAESQLGWVLDNRDLGLFKEAGEELFLTARLRLARVKLAQGEPRRALELLSAVEPGAFAPMYAEVRGDAHIALGQTEEARLAYEEAAASGANSALVELKLRDLGTI